MSFRALAPLMRPRSVSLQDIMLAVNPNVPANNLQELIAYARANPGKLNSMSLPERPRNSPPRFRASFRNGES